MGTGLLKKSLGVGSMVRGTCLRPKAQAREKGKVREGESCPWWELNATENSPRGNSWHLSLSMCSGHNPECEERRCSWPLGRQGRRKEELSGSSVV